MKTKVVAIVQARMGSVRLPGKVMQSLTDKTVIEILTEDKSIIYAHIVETKPRRATKLRKVQSVS